MLIALPHPLYYDRAVRSDSDIRPSSLPTQITNMDTFINYLDIYRLSLPADYYIIRIVKANSSQKTQPRRYTYHQFVNCHKYLVYMNQQGYHIYGRPEGYEFVLIDDISIPSLKCLMSYKPALVVETSPRNFQAWLHLSCAPTTRQEALSICRTACTHLAGDWGSADPDHVGRLPGFFNLKPHYRNTKGRYPKVILHHALDQYTSLSLQGPKAVGGVSKLNTKYHTNESMVDRSKEDFALACQLWKSGVSRSAIEQEIALKEKGRNRPDYVKRTVEAAYNRVLAEKK